MTDKKLADELERLENGANSWEVSTPTEERFVIKRPLTHVMQVRLTEEQWSQLREQAQEIGVGPSTLLRMWTMERLRTGPREPRGTAAVSPGATESPRR